MLFVTPVYKKLSKKSHEVERLQTTTVSFPVILFHLKSNRYNLNAKYRIGYRYWQISVIKKSEYRFLAISVHH